MDNMNIFATITVHTVHKAHVESMYIAELLVINCNIGKLWSQWGHDVTHFSWLANWLGLISPPPLCSLAAVLCLLFSSSMLWSTLIIWPILGVHIKTIKNKKSCPRCYHLYNYACMDFWNVNVGNDKGSSNNLSQPWTGKIIYIRNDLWQWTKLTKLFTQIKAKK